MVKNGFGLYDQPDNRYIVMNSYEQFIQHWNSLPHVPIHKLRTKNADCSSQTKLVQQAIQYIKQLKAGIFMVDKHLEPFCEENDIPTLLDKMTSDDINKGLERLALMFDPRYKPKNKSKLTRALDHLMFESNCSGYDNLSIFLKTFYHPPKLLYDSPEVEDAHPKMTQIVVDTLDNKDISYGDRCKLIRHMDAIYEVNNHIDSKDRSENINMVRRYYPKEIPQNLLRAFIEYLQEQDWITRITVDTYNPDSKLFDMFLRHEEKDLDVKFGT